MSGLGDGPAPGRLLILDDDEAVGRTLGLCAQGMGLQTRVVGDVAAFVHQLDTWSPTHIALDLVMPEMDGVQILHMLAQRHCAAMIIITSGLGGRVLAAAQRSAEEQSLNIAGVLPKPFDPSTLRELLGKLPLARPGERTPGQAAERQPEISEDELARAMDRGEIELAYQPKIDSMNGRVAGFEALARWRRPDGELVMPDRFIGVAERGELIHRLTGQVCDIALRWLSGWSSAPPFNVSINISPRNLVDLDLADQLANQCEERGLDPSRVILELTETSAMADPVSSLALLTRFRMKRFHLSIDDFGTGYSSMLQLVRLPFSEMKIDKSFVANASRSQESRTVIQSIVDLGHSLGLTVTGEGVEDAQALQFLRDVGCDLAQGYHIAKPMPGERVADWLADR
jgi:EAL domain-containing protein (putative c-di-GMP-specific phosphodiesterase class I)